MWRQHPLYGCDLDVEATSPVWMVLLVKMEKQGLDKVECHSFKSMMNVREILIKIGILGIRTGRIMETNS